MIKTSLLPRAALLAALSLAAVPALADDDRDRCQAGPQSQWRPMADLEKQLTAQGWRLRKIEIDDGCYEVEAYDKDGWKVEGLFHPKTLERLKPSWR